MIQFLAEKTTEESQTWERHKDPEGLWIALFAGSCLIHLLFFWSLAQAKVNYSLEGEQSSKTVPIEFIELPSKVKPQTQKLAQKPKPQIKPPLQSKKVSPVNPPKVTNNIPKIQGDGTFVLPKNESYLSQIRKQQEKQRRQFEQQEKEFRREQEQIRRDRALVERNRQQEREKQRRQIKQEEEEFRQEEERQRIEKQRQANQRRLEEKKIAQQIRQEQERQRIEKQRQANQRRLEEKKIAQQIRQEQERQRIEKQRQADQRRSEEKKIAQRIRQEQERQRIEKQRQADQALQNQKQPAKPPPPSKIARGPEAETGDLLRDPSKNNPTNNRGKVKIDDPGKRLSDSPIGISVTWNVELSKLQEDKPAERPDKPAIPPSGLLPTIKLPNTIGQIECKQDNFLIRLIIDEKGNLIGANLDPKEKKNIPPLQREACRKYADYIFPSGQKFTPGYGKDPKTGELKPKFSNLPVRIKKTGN
ncbi:MAG: hypothetical protein AAF378_08085 [Cyanobacteria bacterium P01_A01_bin.84]